MNYMLRHWDAFARFLDDGRICLTNNGRRESATRHSLGSAQLDLRRFSVRHRSRRRYTRTHYPGRLNDVDLKGWLADILARIAGLPTSRLHELMTVAKFTTVLDSSYHRLGRRC